MVGLEGMLNVTAEPFCHENKEKGDRGSPCRSPLVALKVADGAPFSRIEKFGVEIMLKTHFTHLSQNPKALRMVSRYFQLNLS